MGRVTIAKIEQQFDAIDKREAKIKARYTSETRRRVSHGTANTQFDKKEPTGPTSETGQTEGHCIDLGDGRHALIMTRGERIKKLTAEMAAKRSGGLRKYIKTAYHEREEVLQNLDKLPDNYYSTKDDDDLYDQLLQFSESQPPDSTRMKAPIKRLNTRSALRSAQHVAQPQLSSAPQQPRKNTIHVRPPSTVGMLFEKFKSPQSVNKKPAGNKQQQRNHILPEKKNKIPTGSSLWATKKKSRSLLHKEPLVPDVASNSFTITKGMNPVRRNPPIADDTDSNELNQTTLEMINSKKYYFLHVKILHGDPAVIRKWRFDVKVTDTTFPECPISTTFQNLRVTDTLHVVFEEPNNCVLSPVDLLDWVSAPIDLYNHTLHIEVTAVSPVRTKVVDTLVYYGEELDSAPKRPGDTPDSKRTAVNDNSTRS